MSVITYIKRALMNTPRPRFTSQTTKLENFQPRVAPGLEIALVTIGGKGGNIEIHYKPKK